MHNIIKTRFDYYRSDIRLHNSQQAGKIARRHGVESSFSEGHIPKSYEKGRLVTSKSNFLINRSVSIMRHVDSDNQTGDELYMQETQLNQAMQQVHGQPVYTYHSSDIPEIAYRQPVSSTPSNNILQMIDETASQVNKKVMRAVSEREIESQSQASMGIAELDPEQVAVKVYRLMCRDMVLEMERGAFC